MRGMEQQYRLHDVISWMRPSRDDSYSAPPEWSVYSYRIYFVKRESPGDEPAPCRATEAEARLEIVRPGEIRDRLLEAPNAFPDILKKVWTYRF